MKIKLKKHTQVFIMNVYKFCWIIASKILQVLKLEKSRESSNAEVS